MTKRSSFRRQLFEVSFLMQESSIQGENKKFNDQFNRLKLTIRSFGLFRSMYKGKNKTK